MGTAQRRSLFVVVPVLNEAPNLPALFEGLRLIAVDAAEFDVVPIVVDDGSTDGTSRLAEELGGHLGVTVLRHERNQGPGRAFGTAFLHLTSMMRHDDLVVTMEGDNTSRAELVSAMLRRLDEGFDAVLASPYMYGGGILNTRPSRVMLSHIANAFVKEFLGVHGILTVSSFFRLYRATAVRRLQECYGDAIIERAGFESMVEVVMKMIYLGMAISEVPMVLDTTLRVGKSKLNTRRTAMGYMSLFRRKRAWRERASPAQERGGR